MLSRLQKASKRIWARMMIIFVVCLFPLLGLQILIQEWGTNLIREQVYNTAYANVDYLSSHFQTNIETLHTTAEYLINVDIVREFFVFHDNYSTAEYYEKIDNIQDFLYRMNQSNPFIGETRLYFPRSRLMISVSHNGMAYLNTDTVEIERRVSSSRNLESLLIEENGEYRVCTWLGSLSGDQLPALYVEIFLNRDVMVQHLSSFTASGEKLSFQYNHAADTILFSNGMYLSGDDALRFKSILNEKANAPYSCIFSLDHTDYVLVAASVPSIRTSFGQLILVSDLDSIPHALQLGMYLFVAVFALALSILLTMMRRQISSPTKRLLTAFDATGEGKFETRIHDDTRTWPLEYQQLSLHFNDMNAHTQQLIAEIYEQQNNLRQAQLKQLQAQINPHFLYNSFFLLRSVIASEEYRQAERFLLCLGNYFRYITNNVTEDAALEEEYEHAQNYLSIQLMRFDDLLELDIPPLPESLKHIRVPRLMLQPLYENVLVHGVWKNGEPRRIHLWIEESDQMATLSISDNGSDVTPELIESVRSSLTSNIPYEFTSGMTNIHHRLSLLGKGGGLDVGKSYMGGFRVIVRIPKER